MNTIDYVYRFDPKNPSTKPPSPQAYAKGEPAPAPAVNDGRTN